MGRLGRMALRVPDRQALLDEAVAIVTETLGIADCAILELVEGGDRVRLAAATGAAIDPDADPEELAHRGPPAHRLGRSPARSPSPSGSGRASGASTPPGCATAASAAPPRPRSAGAPARSGSSASTPPTLGVFSADDAQWLQSMADLLASALDRDESEARMRHQSLHDGLTGLPNRTLFYDRIEHAFARAQRAETLVAVLLLDVDQFKTINDSLGHEAGDDLLVALSARLQHVIRGSDTVARLGGDEFVVLLRGRVRGRVVRRRRAHRRRLGAADPGRDRRRDLRLGEHRHHDRAPAPERRDDAPRGRRRDVPGQGGRPRPLRALRRGDAPARLLAPAHRERPAPRRRARAVPRPLPADLRRRRAPAARRRGARALGPPGQRHRRPGRVHRPHRGDRPHRPARPLGARAGHRAGRASGASASRTPPTSASPSTSPAASSPAPSSSPRSRARSAAAASSPAASASRSPRAS